MILRKKRKNATGSGGRHFLKSVLSYFFVSVFWTTKGTVQSCAKQCIVHKEKSAFTVVNDMKAALFRVI